MFLVSAARKYVPPTTACGPVAQMNILILDEMRQIDCCACIYSVKSEIVFRGQALILLPSELWTLIHLSPFVFKVKLGKVSIEPPDVWGVAAKASAEKPRFWTALRIDAASSLINRMYLCCMMSSVVMSKVRTTVVRT